MLLRLLSTLVLAPLVIGLLLHGSSVQFFMVGLGVSTLLLYEWHRLRLAWFSWRGLQISVAFAWLMLWLTQFGLGQYMPLALSLMLVALMTTGVARYQPGVAESGRIGHHFMGLAYCLMPMVFLLQIKQMEKGGELLLYLFLVIWATDIGAYLVGKAMGRHKLIPRISPGKTWEGSAGGTLTAMVTGVLTTMTLALPIELGTALVLSLLLSLVSQVGDLAESLFKREIEIKDSGALIPGHGGMLDRLDSLLFAAPVFALYLQWTRGFGG